MLGKHSSPDFCYKIINPYYMPMTLMVPLGLMPTPQSKDAHATCTHHSPVAPFKVLLILTCDNCVFSLHARVSHSLCTSASVLCH